MFFEYDITVTKLTTEATAEETRLPLSKGIINFINVQFPIGCAGLVHCRLEHHTFPHFPSNPSGNFKSDGFIIPVQGPIKFLSEPHEVNVVAWNEDDSLDHTITLRFDITESEPYIRMIKIFEGLAKLLKLAGIKV